MLATGAANIGEVQRAVHTILACNTQLVLMQCNTNYTASLENFKYVNLNVLKTYAAMFPQVVLGLSDHTPGHSAVLGAVTLGARVVEKHFTDDNSREGPDHAFALDAHAWGEMVKRTRELEYALGSGDKIVAGNEQETVVLQRRCLRAARDIQAGEELTRRDDRRCARRTPARSCRRKLTKVIGTKTATAIPTEGIEVDGSCILVF